MALGDIKDAGILAGFVRWGWPYHGLCTGTTIASSGKTIPQPLNGNTWLIDKGLPPLDIAPGVIASEAAEGREWWNYALISGSVLYGKTMPYSTDAYGNYPTGYIHIDESGVPWLVALSFSFPATNTVRVSASIKRFGLFHPDLGPQTPITKTADAACENVEHDGGGLYGRQVRLHDVHTNGSKALACVEMFFTFGSTALMVMSAINVTFSGSGGSDGSGLTMSAAEVRGRSSLYDSTTLPSVSASGAGTGVYGGTISASLSTFDPACPGGVSQTNTGTLDNAVEVTWTGNSILLSQGVVTTFCRACFYDMNGDVVALRIRRRQTSEGTLAITSGPTMVVSVQQNVCGTGWTTPLEHNVQMRVDTTETRAIYLLQNDTVVDSIVFTRATHATQNKTIYNNAGVSSSTSTNYWDQIGTPSWGGSLAASFPTTTPAVMDPLVAGFLSPNKINSHTMQLYASPDHYVGVYRNSLVAALYTETSSVKTFGTIATPLGNKTTALTSNFYYSFQRKTGDFSFSLSPICYV